MKITIYGAGYVGLVTGACLAEVGNEVLCVDVDEERIASLNRGEVPIHEPGLSALAWRPGDDPARLVQASADAKYTLDGVARSSASNTIASAAPGLSLELTATNIGAPTTISFSNSMLFIIFCINSSF